MLLKHLKIRLFTNYNMFGIKTNKQLREEIKRLEHQIGLMQNHIQAQKVEKMNLNKKIKQLEMLWDVEAKRKIY